MENEQSQSVRDLKKMSIVAVMLAGTFIAVLNQSLLNVALPIMMSDLQISANTAQWLTTIYLLVNGVMIPIAAFLIRRFTTRGLFLTMMTIFTVGTATATVAPNFSILLTGRVLQAAGAGVMMPLMSTVFFTIFPVEKRGSIMGLVGLVIAFAPAIGPSLSGWLVENHSWHFIFLVILPIAFVVLVVTYFVLKNVTEQTRPKIDILSIFLSSLGFGGLLYGFSSAGNNGWGSVEAVGVLTIGGVSLALFIWRQFILKNPMLEFRVFQYGIFPLTTLISMIVYILMISVGLILSLYMQNMRGFTPIETGLLILPGGLAMGMMSLISGRIFDKFGARWLAVIGLGIVTVATFPFVNLDASTPYTYILVLYTVRMLGLAMVLAPIGTAGLNQLPFHLIPHGTAMSNTMRQVAASTGTALLVTVMTNGAASARQQMMTQPEIHGVDIAFGVTAGLAFVGFILAFFVRSKSLVSKKVMEE